MTNKSQVNAQKIGEQPKPVINGFFRVLFEETSILDAFDALTPLGYRPRRLNVEGHSMVDASGWFPAWEGERITLVAWGSSASSCSGVTLVVEGKRTPGDPSSETLYTLAFDGTTRTALLKDASTLGFHYLRVRVKLDDVYNSGVNELTELKVDVVITPGPSSDATLGSSPTIAAGGFTEVDASSLSADTTPPSGGAIATNALDVSRYTQVVVRFIPDDLAATWDFQIWGANVGDTAMDKLREGADTSQSGRLRMNVNVQGIDYLFATVANISAGDVAVEMAPIL